MPSRCSLCLKEAESVNQLFLQCPWAYSIWCDFLLHFNVKWAAPPSVKSLVWLWSAALGKGFSRKGEVIWRCIPSAFCWGLWKKRNARIFKERYTVFSWVSFHPLLKEEMFRDWMFDWDSLLSNL